MLSDDVYAEVVEHMATTRRKKRLSFAPTLSSIVAYSTRAPPVDVGTCVIETCLKDSEETASLECNSLWELKTRHWSDSTTLLARDP